MLRVIVLAALVALVVYLLVKYVLPDLRYLLDRLLRRYGYAPAQRPETIDAVPPAAGELEGLLLAGRITPGQQVRLAAAAPTPRAERVEVALYANELWHALGFLPSAARREAILQFVRLVRGGELPDPDDLPPPLASLVRAVGRQEHTPGTLRETVQELLLVAREMTAEEQA